MAQSKAFHQVAYWNMLNKAEYYAWCAIRNHVLPGGDPISGHPRRPREWGIYNESREAYKAMAKFWIGQAGNYRSLYR